MALGEFTGNKKEAITVMLPKLERGQIVYACERVTVKDADANGLTVIHALPSGEKFKHYLPWAQVIGLKIES